MGYFQLRGDILFFTAETEPTPNAVNSKPVLRSICEVSLDGLTFGQGRRPPPAESECVRGGAAYDVFSLARERCGLSGFSLERRNCVWGVSVYIQGNIKLEMVSNSNFLSQVFVKGKSFKVYG